MMSDPKTEFAEHKAAIKATFESMLDDLERQRDELKLQVHLGKQDARDQWNRLRAEMDELREKLDRGYDEAGVTADKFESATKASFEELRKGVVRIRELF
jgi:hypothetical protein